MKYERFFQYSPIKVRGKRQRQLAITEMLFVGYNKRNALSLNFLKDGIVCSS